MSPTDFNLFRQGGGIMWVLLGLGMLLAILAIERLIYLHRRQIRSTVFINGIKNSLAKRRLVEALTVCEETPGPVAAVTKAALLHADEGADLLRFHVQEAAVVELPALERRLGGIAAIAQVAPLVGLLGTVLGMGSTFLVFYHNNYVSWQELSLGMWESILCTAGALILAIPAHLIHHLLAGRVRAIVRDIEWSANEIMRYLLTEYRSAAPAAGPVVAAAPPDMGVQGSKAGNQKSKIPQ